MKKFNIVIFYIIHLVLLILLIYLNSSENSIYDIVSNYSVNIPFMFSLLFIESFCLELNKVSGIVKNHLLLMSFNLIIFVIFMAFDNTFMLEKILILCINLTFVLFILLFLNFLLCYTSSEIKKDKLFICVMLESIYYCFCYYYGNNIVFLNIFRFLLAEKFSLFILIYYVFVLSILILFIRKRGIYVRDRKY